MIIMTKKFYALAAGILTIFSLNASAKDISSVHVRGSTTLLPIAQQVAEAYMVEHKDARVVLSGGGTARGYKAVLDGTADIAMASSLIPDDINNIAKLKNQKLKTTLLGYATILAVVHRSNSVNNLSLKQLKDIFTGRITNWKNLGGLDAPIKVYVGTPTGGITDTWKSLILGEEDTYTPSGRVLDNTERLRQIELEPNAVTFLTLDASSYSKIKILSIDNITPDSHSVNDGRYSLRAPLMLITTAKPKPQAQAFIDYFSAPEHAARFIGMVKLAENDSHPVDKSKQP